MVEKIGEIVYTSDVLPTVTTRKLATEIKRTWLFRLYFAISNNNNIFLKKICINSVTHDVEKYLACKHTKVLGCKHRKVFKVCFAVL